MPDAKTDTDRFILEQGRAVLQPGEEVLTFAYLVPPIEGGRVGVFISAATAKAAFAVVTSQRLLLIETRIGAFAPLLENLGVVSIERKDLKGVHVGTTLIFEVADGRMLEYQSKRSLKQVSAQGDFFGQIEAILGRSEAAASLASKKSWTNLVATVVGVLIAIAYLLYRTSR